ncbi:MAG: DUF3570 domain-containing protein [Polyangiaceae bacterium]
MTVRLALRCLGALTAAMASLLSSAPALAQVAELKLGTTVFHEPSKVGSQMTVINPNASLAVTPWEWITVSAGYEADVVSGASEPVKAGPLSSPDVISQASVEDVRHVATGGFTLRKKNTRLSAGYAYAQENDYRSHGFSVSTATDFFQKNTEIELSYARGFDRVCNAAYPESRDPSLRQPLDSSKGCFANADDRQELDIDIDNFQAAWSQAWTPVLTTQVITTFQLQHGFLGNPYRGVVVGPSGQIAQEHHPENRARNALAVRAKYYVRGIQTAFGVGVRAYRDTWDILGQTYQVDAERFMMPWLRVMLRGRYYQQTGALFWSDDYTGGEPLYGPRGQYWSGDREVSPMRSFLFGGRVLGEWRGAPGNRLLGMMLNANAGANFDMIQTELEDFTLAGQNPDDTFAVVFGLHLGGGF